MYDVREALDDLEGVGHRESDLDETHPALREEPRGAVRNVGARDADDRDDAVLGEDPHAVAPRDQRSLCERHREHLTRRRPDRQGVTFRGKDVHKR